MDVIVPMAGHGARFAAEGFSQPKPLIPIRGRPMLDWALDPVPPGWLIWAPCRVDQLALYAPRVPPSMRLMPLAGVTEGAACTVLAAAVALDPQQPVAVMNCDQTFRSDLGVLHIRAITEGWDGVILTFCSREDRWSYVACPPGTDWVREVVEKQPISDHATVGYYWFRRAGDLVWAICDMIARNARVRGEFYLAPVYQGLIARGARVKAIACEGFISFGTPADVRAFEAS